MKLRNKKTGYVTNWCIDKDVIRTCDGSIVYNSLAELNADWEDVEEPKEYWIIDWTSSERIDVFKYSGDDVDIFNKSIGNYFKSREEAEKAVERLRAWKRLKDKGFRFTAWKNGILFGETVAGQVRYEFPIDNKDDIEKDLDLLFGGEE